MILMKSEIKNIRIVYKFGAFGNPNAFGCWIYGKRPDGKTVACKHDDIEGGGIRIWSYWISPNCSENEIDECETEFSKDEWELIQQEEDYLQSFKCNQILRERMQ